jgi:thiamine-monophosphate kinase
MVRRNGAKAGDALYVSGTIGDAVLGLKLRGADTEAANWPLDDAGRQFLTARYLRPAPRIALRDALLAHASAAMDVSDGLAIDASRLCAASGVRIHIDASAVPLSRPAQKLRNAEAISLATLISGGDDYEILAAIPPASEEAFVADAASREVPVTRIGRIAEGAGLDIRDATGTPLALDRLGYDHFRG